MVELFQPKKKKKKVQRILDPNHMLFSISILGLLVFCVYNKRKLTFFFFSLNGAQITIFFLSIGFKFSFHSTISLYHETTLFLFTLSVHLGSAFCASQIHICVSALFFFFFSRKVWLFNQFSATCGSRALFTDPKISLFNNFFIKNGSHGTIYTFKNYFAIVFFSFQLYPNGP